MPARGGSDVNGKISIHGCPCLYRFPHFTEKKRALQCVFSAAEGGRRRPRSTFRRRKGKSRALRRRNSSEKDFRPI